MHASAQELETYVRQGKDFLGIGNFCGETDINEYQEQENM